jgi:hypothetical protein
MTLRVSAVVDRLPRAWTASVRRRRLFFIATIAPGVALAELGAGILQDPLVLGLGVALVLAAVALRWRSEPRFLARERRALAAANDLETPA